MKLIIFCAVLGLALASEYGHGDQGSHGGSHGHDGGYGSHQGYQRTEKHHSVSSGAKQNYNGQYGGKCDHDGFYYNDGGSFVICSNSNAYVQPCAPGTRNSGADNYRQGNSYNYRDFCDVNLVDFGYGVRHGGYGHGNGHSSGHGTGHGSYGNSGHGGYGSGHSARFGSGHGHGFGGHQGGYGPPHGGYGGHSGHSRGY